MLIVRTATNPGGIHNIFQRLDVRNSNERSMEICISLTKDVAFVEVIQLESYKACLLLLF